MEVMAPPVVCADPVICIRRIAHVLIETGLTALPVADPPLSLWA